VSPRRRRMLTSDEQALWAHVTRHVAPIAGEERNRLRASKSETPAPTEALEGMTPANPAPIEAKTQAGTKPARKTPGKFEKPAWKAGSSMSAAPAVAPSPPPAPPLAPLERRLRQRLSRGSHPIDAVIDLHGLRQEEAHAALRGFLLSAQRQGHAVVLVVTGKGGAAAASKSLFEERGVLRRIVPHWLRLPDLRAVVVGFEEAVQHHGGAGALYVRIRRVRSGP
jgi:DNA-nicking Smr family endonuclease